MGGPFAERSGMRNGMIGIDTVAGKAHATDMIMGNLSPSQGTLRFVGAISTLPIRGSNVSSETALETSASVLKTLRDACATVTRDSVEMI